MQRNPESVEAAKRVKQLENQNLKLKRLLQTAIDISNQDMIGTTRLRTENVDLANVISNLEGEKRRLELELAEILENSESGMVRALRTLEQEHTDLQIELNALLTGSSEEQVNVMKLATEDIELRSELIQLEREKVKLLEKIRKVEEKKKTLSQQKLSETNNIQVNNTENAEGLTNNATNSEENILSTFLQLEQTYKQYIDVLEEHTIENKISELITKNDQLVGESKLSKNEVRQSQIKLNETILNSNTDILNKIKEVKSKLATCIEKNATILNTTDENKIISSRISDMEKEKDLIYEELEDYLRNSSKDVSKMAENVDDPEIKLLIHEIEVQKAVLLYNLKMLKMKDEMPAKGSTNANDNKEILAPPSSPASMLHRYSGEIRQLYTNDNEHCSTSSSHDIPETDGHRRLEETVIRLENERKMLLKKLHSISTTTSQECEERQLQTQSELHCNFMREESSQELIIAKNLDDATNQLYTEEDIRLEQRIRELEIENNRIKKEVQRIMESTQDHQLPAQILRERIEQLEVESQNPPRTE